MISKVKSADNAFVWIWLPGKDFPVVAGHIIRQNEKYDFNYGRSYLEQEQAISLSPFELSLKPGRFTPEGLNVIHSCLRDAAPDAWGRRLIDYQYQTFNANELDYMLLSGSERIGALDFQASSLEYVPREISNIKLENFLQLTEWVEKNQPLPLELEPLLLRGTSIGGARPKAMIFDDHTGFIAKFGLSTDVYDVIKAEYIAMRLAKQVGLEVSEVKLRTVLGKNVLLVKRFDRVLINNLITRRLMLSGLSILGLNEMEARYASYRDFADIIRQQFFEPKTDLLELYKRLIFNVLIGNTDDHARNFSAFWDGKALKLTPAYDLCPQPRAGQIATQAMAIDGIEGNFSTLTNVLSVSESFQISKDNAREIIEEMLSSIRKNWVTICEEADLTIIERNRLWENVILNPFCFQAWA